MTEAQFQERVLALARIFGWSWFHPYDSRRSVAGWPDLVLCKPPRLLICELKSETGRVAPTQQRWLELLGACGVEAEVWRPRDLVRIAEILGGMKQGPVEA